MTKPLPPGLIHTPHQEIILFRACRSTFGTEYNAVSAHRFVGPSIAIYVEVTPAIVQDGFDDG